MQMRPEVQIKSVIKALTDVIVPAVDANNKLAQEQSRLVIGLLTLLSQQLPLQFRFDCDELARLLAFSEQLQALAAGGEGTRAALAELGTLTAAASAALDGARSGPDLIEQSVRKLRAATGEVLTQVYRDGDPACRDRIRDATLAMSKEQLLRDRSLLLMQGWEPDPKAVPSIDSLLEAASR